MSSKVADPNRIASLQAMVEAAREEFDQAAALHESWKIMAFDQDLHERMGTSRATTTFHVIRSALRREVILALMKLWDRPDSSAISMTRLLRALEDPVLIDAFADQVRRLDAVAPDSLLEGRPEAEHKNIQASHVADECLFGELLTEEIKREANNLRDILFKYTEGDGSCTIDYLKGLRDKRIAHRQIKLSKSEAPSTSEGDDVVEKFYQDMSDAIRGMFVVTKGIDYRPESTAALWRHHAVLFWNGVRGERTEGHPNYRSP